MSDLSYLVAKQRQDIIDYYKNLDELQTRRRIKEEVEKEEKAKANKTTIEELEKIKEKVKQRNIPSKRTCQNVYEVGVLDGRTTEKVEILDIIEKEIAELKGESNE